MHTHAPSASRFISHHVKHEEMIHNEALVRAQAEADKKEAEKRRRAEAAAARMEARRKSKLPSS